MTHHVLAEKGEAFERAHGLRGRVDVAEHDVRLAAHLGRLERDDVDDDAIRGEEHVQISLEVVLGELVGEVADVEPGRVSLVHCLSNHLQHTFGWAVSHSPWQAGRAEALSGREKPLCVGGREEE